jgi:hypothetical protein
MKTTITAVWHPRAATEGELALLTTEDSQKNKYSLHVLYDRKKHATGKNIKIEFVGRRNA